MLRRQDADLSHTVSIRARTGIYKHIYHSLREARGVWCVRRDEGLGHMFVSQGEGERSSRQADNRAQKTETKKSQLSMGLLICLLARAHESTIVVPVPTSTRTQPHQ